MIVVNSVCLTIRLAQLGQALRFIDSADQNVQATEVELLEPDASGVSLGLYTSTIDLWMTPVDKGIDISRPSFIFL